MRPPCRIRCQSDKADAAQRCKRLFLLVIFAAALLAASFAIRSSNDGAGGSSIRPPRHEPATRDSLDHFENKVAGARQNVEPPADKRHRPATTTRAFIDATAQRQALRRTLRTRPKTVGAGGPPASEPVMLLTHRILTARTSGAGIATRDGLSALNAHTSDSTLSISSRDAFPFIIQFEGPVQSVWLADLDAAGVLVHDYLPRHAFLVEGSAEALAAAAALPQVRWIGPYRPEYKLEPLLSVMATAAVSERDADQAWFSEAVLTTPVPVTIQTLSAGDADDVAAELQAAGIVPEQIIKNPRWGRVNASIPPTRLALAAAMAPVVWIEEKLPHSLRNDLAVQPNRMNVAPAWDLHGLTGSGQVIGHADTGLDTGDYDNIHPDFAGRIVFAVGLATGRILGRGGRWDDPDGHGTHTAGSILGSGAASGGQYRGVAYDALLVHQSLIDRLGLLTGIPRDLNILFQQAYTNDARIHSDSWGSASAGGYTADALDCDQHTWDYPDMLLVFAAGNEGADGNADGIIDSMSVGSPATAKNVLSVGASESGRPPGSGGFSSLTYGGLWPGDYPENPIADDYISSSPNGHPIGLAAFSSRGPTDDDRMKPDVVAPGTDIISCRSQHDNALDGWGAHSNSYYTFMGGTSMSTPLVAGGAALVRQYYMEHRGMTSPPPSAALLKATLINSARSLTPGQYGLDAEREIPPPPRPNIAEGWGEVDLQGALFPTPPRNLVFIDGQILATGEAHTFNFSVTNTGDLSITLVWSDHPPALPAAVKLVNDLDLTITAPCETVFFPNGLDQPDRRNNVESIDIPSAAIGTYILRIDAENVPFGPQPYALVLHGNLDWENADIVHFATSQYAVDAGDPVTIEVQRGGDKTGTVSVAYTTVDGTALAGVDYLPAAGTMTFTPDQSFTNLTLTTMERMGPGEDRTFNLQLYQPEGDVLIHAPSQTVVTVRHHRGPGSFRFSKDRYDAGEGDGWHSLTVERVNGLEGPVSVAFRTSDGSARAGLDYISTNGILEFADAATSRSFKIQILDNGRPFAERILNVELQQPTGGAWLSTPATSMLAIASDAGLERSFIEADFEDGLPLEWQVATNGEHGAVWRFDDPGERGNLTGGPGEFAIADSEHAGAVNMDTALLTPAVNLSRLDTVTLRFRMDFYLPDPGEAIGEVDYSLAGPDGPWQNIERIENLNVRGPRLQTIDISAETAGRQSVTIRFRYRNSTGNGWIQIDDVWLSGEVADGYGDRDADGLPDWWENFYFQDPTAAAPGDDDSGSGRTNFEEYIAGTDPTDNQARFLIKALEATVTGTLFHIGSLTDRVYRLLSATNLPDAQWIPGPAVYGVEGPLTLFDPREGTNLYYRIDVQLTP